MITATTALDLLAILVGMPTITDDAAANDIALDYLEQYFSERGMHCKRHRFDGHGALTASTRPDNAKRPTVLLAGHIDVTSGGETLFTLRQEGDKLFGRGVYDMKFAVAGYMQLVDELKGSLGSYDFAVMITSDEEWGNRDGINGTHRLVEAGYRPRICLLPDSAAPGWDVEHLAKGHWRFDLIATGRTAHGSRPWEGESASFKLLQALHELKALFGGHGPQTDTLNIGLIHGGETYNKIPDHMSAGIEIRIMSEESYHETLAVVKTICDRHGIIYKERTVVMPLKTNLQDPLIQTYMGCVEKITGRLPEGILSFAGTDAPHFSEAGVPCIISCPEGGRHHSENEWISKNSFLRFVPILRAFITQTTTARSTSVDTPASVV